jgi:uncharacterized protein (DUF1697 family)
MTAYVALLRAVNVGGTGKLPMRDLAAICEAQGFEAVKTYIASGNVVFRATAHEAAVQASLEGALQAYAGKPVGVHLRTAEQMREVLETNPFPHGRPNRVLATFLAGPPPADALVRATGVDGEEMALGAREIYVHYGEAMGQSKLRIPAAAAGTARNMNTVAALARLAADLKL